MAGDFVLSLLFFLSGTSGLIFEIVWLYRCDLVFGSTVSAATLTLSSFMGGLALGNALADVGATRIRRPLRAYAAAEFIVAMAGIAVVYVLSAPARLILPLAPHLIDKPFLDDVVRLLTTFAVLLIPSTAMGVTLPLLVGELSCRRRGFGVALGRLYGWNTLGAVIGSVGAEAVLIQRFGISGAAWIAGLFDCAVGVAALWLSRHEWPPPLEPSRVLRSGRRPIALPPARSVRPRLVLCAAFTSGGTLLALEVVWFRFLSMFVLTTTLAMSLLLAVVLASIGLGGLAMSNLLARSDRIGGYLPVLSMAAAAATVISYVSFNWLTAGTQVAHWHRVLWFASVLTLPTSFVSGALFTLLGDELARSVSGGVRAAARLTLANTTGAMCGPIVALFVLLPALGMERAIFASALSYAGIAVLTMPRLEAGQLGAHRWGIALKAAPLILLLAGFPFGLMRTAYFPRVAAAYAADGSEIVAAREGPSETIFLMQERWLGQPVYSRLVTNGFSMSGTAVPAMRYMRDFVYLPMFLRRDPLRRVLVVCYGVGVTTGAATDIPSVESIDIVEISKDIATMSDVVYAGDRHPLRDPRVRLHLTDARYVLETTTSRFDLITGEPPPPRTPGAVNIYTREYFSLMHDRLADGGIASYWLPVARPDPGTDVETIIRAFCEVFADCSLWNATPFDFLLVGTRDAAGPISESGLAAAWRTPRLAGRLREIGFEQPEQIGATFLGDATYLRELTSNTPPLTDDYPQRLRPSPARLSLSDPRYRDNPAVAELYWRVLDPDRARRLFTTSPFIRRFFPPALIDRTVRFFDAQRQINRVLWEGGQPLRLIDDLNAVLTHTSLRTLALWMLGTDDVKQRIAATGHDDDGSVEYARAAQALADRDYSGAVLAFAEAERRGLRSGTVRGLRAYALCRGGRVDEAAALAPDAGTRQSPDEAHFWKWLREEFQMSG